MLNACVKRPSGYSKEVVYANENYTEKEIENLRSKIKKTTFPKVDGYIESILKKDSYLKTRSASFVLPGPKGQVALDPYILRLNSVSTLYVYKEHYPNGNSPLSTDRIIIGAEIITERTTY